ncbi:MAG TPA: patatin-like phospholipase family protein [Ramlibacter sp.]|nr:patatin-like phospholipase family protein [Ramlibacter sp.]
MSSRKPRIGLALGGGAARGWAHIGVIRALAREGIAPEVVCGTSIGALVGAAYAAGEIERLDQWVQQLDWAGVMSLMDWRINGGLMKGTKLVDFFRAKFEDRGIERLLRPFGCVATELTTGREVWLREGSVIDAVRASLALPGLFTPVVHDGRLLVDGGLVNPVPVSLCRALGADLVIAVDLGWDLIGRRAKPPELEGVEPGAARNALIDAVFGRFRQRSLDPAESPSLTDVVLTSLNIMQVRIAQSRLAGEPPDVLIRPHLAGIVAMDFHRGAVAAAEGERAAAGGIEQLRTLLA